MNLESKPDAPRYSHLEKRWIELCFAASQGDTVNVKKLLKLKVQPDCKDPSNISHATPLHYSARKGLNHLKKYCMSILCDFSNTYCVIAQGHIQIMDILLNMRQYTRVDINTKDAYGWTPLHYAVSQKRTVQQKIKGSTSNIISLKKILRLPIIYLRLCLYI